MSSVEKKFYGVASATVGTMKLTGQMLSMGYPLFLRSVKAAFIIFAALCFAGIFASLARGKIKEQKKSSFNVPVS